jgi:hypothetical protein
MDTGQKDHRMMRSLPAATRVCCAENFDTGLAHWFLTGAAGPGSGIGFDLGCGREAKEREARSEKQIEE